MFGCLAAEPPDRALILQFVGLCLVNQVSYVNLRILKRSSTLAVCVCGVCLGPKWICVYPASCADFCSRLWRPVFLCINCVGGAFLNGSRALAGCGNRILDAESHPAARSVSLGGRPRGCLYVGNRFFSGVGCQPHVWDRVSKCRVLVCFDSFRRMPRVSCISAESVCVRASPRPMCWLCFSFESRVSLPPRSRATGHVLGLPVSACLSDICGCSRGLCVKTRSSPVGISWTVGEGEGSSRSKHFIAFRV